MDIVVVSDTHSASILELPDVLLDDIRAADCVIHAGDFGTKETYIGFEETAKKLYAVRGNNDFFSPIPKEIVIEVGGITIAVTHGNRAYSTDVPSFLESYFGDHMPDLIIHGHTHIPNKVSIGKTIIINPGSPTLNRKVNYNSYIKLQINNKQFSLKLIQLKK